MLFERSMSAVRISQCLFAKPVIFGLLFLCATGHASYFRLRSESTASVLNANVILLGDEHDDVRETVATRAHSPAQIARNAQVRDFINSLWWHPKYLLLVEGEGGAVALSTTGLDLAPGFVARTECYGWDMKNLNDASYVLYSSISIVGENREAELIWKIRMMGFVRSYFMAKKIEELRTQFPLHKIIVLAGASHILDGIAEDYLRKKGIGFASLVAPGMEERNVARSYLENFLLSGGMAESQIPAFFFHADKTTDEFIKQLPSLPAWVPSADDAFYLKHCEECWCHLRTLGKTQYVP